MRSRKLEEIQGQKMEEIQGKVAYFDAVSSTPGLCDIENDRCGLYSAAPVRALQTVGYPSKTRPVRTLLNIHNIHIYTIKFVSKEGLPLAI